MTREEAKEVFLNVWHINVDGEVIYYSDKWREACAVIADWLEGQPCDDAVSREALHKALYDQFHDEHAPNNTTFVTLGSVRNFVKNFPPITCAQSWISCSERLPEEHICNDGYVGPSDAVLITTKSGYVTVSRYWGNRQSKITEEAEERSPEYHDWVEAELWECDVIAWQSLPKPYKVECEMNAENCNCADIYKECGEISKASEQEDILSKVKAELIQAIQNGTIKIESGADMLFRIIELYRTEGSCKE